MKTYLLYFLFAPVLAGCALQFVLPVGRTANLEELSAIQRDIPEPLSLRHGIDPYGIRIDLFRAQRVEDGQTEDIPYNPAGFHLGNHLFMDINGNLSILVDRVLEIEPKLDFTLEEKFDGIFDFTTVYHRSGSQFRSEGGLLGARFRTEIDRDGQQYTIRSPLQIRQNITLTADGLKYESLLDRREMVRTRDGYVVNGLLWSQSFEQRDNSLQLGMWLRVDELDNQIIVSRTSWIGSGLRLYTLFKSDNVWYMLDQFRRLSTLEISSNQVLLNDADGSTVTYRLSPEGYVLQE